MTIVVVKMSIPKVKIAVLKNLLIFGEKYLPQSVRLLEGGVETLFGRMPFEHALSLHGASLKSFDPATCFGEVLTGSVSLLGSKDKQVMKNFCFLIVELNLRGHK